MTEGDSTALETLESLTYVVTFKYDLGGQVRDWPALVQLAGGSQETRRHFDLGVFNFSYVSSRDLPVRIRDEVIVESPRPASEVLHCLTDNRLVVDFAERHVWIYPRGVVSIDYVFRFGRFEWSAFWELIGAMPYEKNLDYTPYLKQELPADMFSKIGHLVGEDASPATDLFDNSSVLASVLETLRGQVEHRAYRYAFHDYRQLAFLHPRLDVDTSALIPLAHEVATMGYPAALDSDVERTTVNGLSLLIGRWACGGVLDPEAGSHAIKNALVMYNHVHTSWFLCQSWIFALDNYIKRLDDMDLDSTSQLATLKKVRRDVDSYQAAIEYSLSEVFAVDLIVKDYSFTKLLTALFRGLNLEQHYTVLSNRRQELERYYTVVTTAIEEKLEEERERQALILEAFFAAVAVFGITSVLLELSRSTFLRNVVILGLIMVVYFAYLVFRIRSLRQRR